MHIIAGDNRGIKLNTPPTNHTRPTLSRVKEAIFSAIHEEVRGSKFLDLFAGTGQMGIEAISRGAAKVVFVDNDQTAIEMIRSNLAKINATNQQVVIADALNILDTQQERFDIIYLDPPYDYPSCSQILASIILKQCLTETGLVILEESNTNQINIPEALEVYKTKKYGKTSIRYIIRKS